MVNPRFAVRTLLRAPFVTVVAVVSLALGIGANAAIFSIFNQVLLRTLPVAEPDRLVNLSAPGPKPGSMSTNAAGSTPVVFSYPMFRDLERLQDPFTDLAAHCLFGANLAYRGQTLHGQGLLVSGGYFPVLGLRPAIGRLLSPDDDRIPGAHPVAVLSHASWQARFDGSSAVVGDTLTVNGQAMTIVGVAPQGFDGTVLGQQPQVFVSITMTGLMRLGWSGLGFEDRRNYWVYLFARLKPGLSLEAARAAINVPYRAIVNDVEVPLQQNMSDRTLEQFKQKTVELEDGTRGQTNIREEARVPLVLLLSVTGVVLLLACANVANLLLAKAADRANEMAVRLSIGASRRQLVGQLLAESFLLAALGGVSGLAVARWTLDAMAYILPAEAISMLEFRISGSVLLFASGLTAATGLIFGIVAALHSTRPDLAGTLKGQAGQPAGARAASRFRASLATAQIALSMMLLVLAGLFTKSLLNVSRVDLGLQVDDVVTFRLSPVLSGYTPEQARTLFERVEDELAAAPGVRAVTASTVPLLGGSNWNNNVFVEGFPAGPDTDTNSRFNRIGPDYFRTFGIPLIAGREFTPADTAGAPKVAVVNQTFARKFDLERETVVGTRMRIGRGTDYDIEIVGLARDAKYSEVKAEIPPQFFLPYRRDDQTGSISFYARGPADKDQIVSAIRAIVARLDATLPVEDLRTMRDQVRENVAVDRLVTLLSAAFAGLATLLAAVGLYGVLAYTVGQRTREIGLRMALGADAARVRRMVLGQVGWMTIAGGLLGMLGALALGRVGASLLFELDAHDPFVLSAAAAALVLVTLSAGFIPAYRASSIEPMRALRYE